MNVFLVPRFDAWHQIQLAVNHAMQTLHRTAAVKPIHTSTMKQSTNLLLSRQSVREMLEPFVYSGLIFFTEYF